MRHNLATETRIDMTPMIDMVFLLLVFFVLTLKPVDLLARHDFVRPMCIGSPPEYPPVEIAVMAEQYRFGDRTVSVVELERNLSTMARLKPDQMILVKSAQDATHERLIQVLDLCAKHGLTIFALLTM